MIADYSMSHFYSETGILKTMTMPIICRNMCVPLVNIKVFGKLESVLSAIKNGSAIWCTDGSFDRVVMPTILSAGWVIFDPLTKHHIRGSFYYASAYRGELLGLTALHLVACAIVELYGKLDKKNTMFCDNQRALEKAKWRFPMIFTSMWKDLSLPEQVNVYCDYLAGVARRESIGKHRDTSHQMLPR
jgi:hypothetical protein